VKQSRSIVEFGVVLFRVHAVSQYADDTQVLRAKQSRSIVESVIATRHVTVMRGTDEDPEWRSGSIIEAEM
jgi:hypothetical protein